MIDTSSLNPPIAADDTVWLFGYGSLIHKVDFPFLNQRIATLQGWTRRFWQGSHDHRGTATSPGRVLTLVEQQNAECKGIAYHVTGSVFDHLDHREKNGYLRLTRPLLFDNGEWVDGVVYIASPDNGAWLGPAPIDDMARQIASSHGPSGSNRDYLLALADALTLINAEDQHVFELAAVVKRYD